MNLTMCPHLLIQALVSWARRESAPNVTPCTVVPVASAMLRPMAESLGRRIDGLRDDVLRQVALARLNGYSYDEIAGQLGCTTRTVIRKIEVIRRHWSEEE